jgi:hypothetical protein
MQTAASTAASDAEHGRVRLSYVDTLDASLLCPICKQVRGLLFFAFFSASLV